VVLHPHMGTVVENGDDVRRVLEGSAIPLCVDTGHLLIAEWTRNELVRGAVSRGGARARQGRRCRPRRAGSGRRAVLTPRRSPRGSTGRSATGTWMSPASSSTLEGAGYDGWYVLEQDPGPGRGAAGRGRSDPGGPGQLRVSWSRPAARWRGRPGSRHAPDRAGRAGRVAGRADGVRLVACRGGQATSASAPAGRPT